MPTATTRPSSSSSPSSSASSPASRSRRRSRAACRPSLSALAKTRPSWLRGRLRSLRRFGGTTRGSLRVCLTTACRRAFLCVEGSGPHSSLRPPLPTFSLVLAQSSSPVSKLAPNQLRFYTSTIIICRSIYVLPVKHSSAKGRERRNSDTCVLPAREPPQQPFPPSDNIHTALSSAHLLRLVPSAVQAGDLWQVGKPCTHPFLRRLDLGPTLLPALDTDSSPPTKHLRRQSPGVHSKLLSTTLDQHLACPRGRTLAPRAACASLRARPPGVRALCSSLT